MSSQSGIACTPELIETFKKYIDEEYRSLIIRVVEEQLVPGKLVKGTQSLEADWEIIQSELSEKEPAFVVVNKDQKGEHLFVSFTPDYAPVRSKMIYASSKNSLLRELGLEFFKPIIFINDIEEISSAGWNSHMAHENLDNPLTNEEESLQRVKDFERLNVGTERRQKLANDTSTFMFHVDEVLKNKLGSISNGELVSCSLDLENESIVLSKDSNFTSPSEILQLISTEKPQYTLLSFKDEKTFIYSCPSGSKVKERMIYASNKLGFVNQFLKKELALEIANVIEVGDLDEIEMSVFETSSSAEPKLEAKSLRFNKPKGPRRR